jgi:hypothetical protein
MKKGSSAIRVDMVVFSLARDTPPGACVLRQFADGIRSPGRGAFDSPAREGGVNVGQCSKAPAGAP